MPTNYLKTKAVLLAEKTPPKAVVITPPLVEDELTATENKVYEAKVGKGFTKVTVNVPTLEADSLSATQNGEYVADVGKGYTTVTVNVPLPASKLPLLISGQITEVTEEDFGNITTIKKYAFSGCDSLTTVTVPATVTSIGTRAFDSIHLTSITFKSTTPPTLASTTVFGDFYGTIYVPAEALETYKTAQYWSNFASAIQPIPS